jgi:NAD(P)H-dependent FMN reductase
MPGSTPKKVAIIIGSTRVVRVGPAVVDLVKKILGTSKAAPAPELSILDVADFKLPVFDERIMPAMVPAYGNFEHEHSKAWSAAIAPFDGYILVSPEYNYGIPSGVKNAIDFLYNEWIGKPVAIITYGIHGGKTSSNALKVTLEGMKLRVVETRPQLTFQGEGMEETMVAAGQGKLGPKTLKHWEETGPESILKAFDELVKLLEAPVSEPVKAT